MTKDAVMQRVRELATERGGHVSLRVFVSETGINDQWLRGQEWWTGWNRLLLEIGIKTREFAVPRTAVPRIVEAVALLVERFVDAGPGERVKGYVYLLRSGRSYKIGKSNDPSRRYREIRLELPDEPTRFIQFQRTIPPGSERTGDSVLLQSASATPNSLLLMRNADCRHPGIMIGMARNLGARQG